MDEDNTLPFDFSFTETYYMPGSITVWGVELKARQECDDDTGEDYVEYSGIYGDHNGREYDIRIVAWAGSSGFLIIRGGFDDEDIVCEEEYYVGDPLDATIDKVVSQLEDYICKKFVKQGEVEL